MSTMKTLTVFAIICAMVTQNSVVGQRARSCPWRWLMYSSRCFRFVPQVMTWAKAEKNCQSMGGNLASVHTTNEYLWIKTMITSITRKYPLTWIGGSDAQQERYWFWSDGLPFRFSYWCKGEPNNYWSQHCLAINHGADKCWDDRKCRLRLPSVCAKKM